MLHEEYNKIFPEKSTEELLHYLTYTIGIFIKKENVEGNSFIYNMGCQYSYDKEAYTYSYRNEDFKKCLQGLIMDIFFTVVLMRWEYHDKNRFIWRHQIAFLKSFFNCDENTAQQYREERMDVINRIAHAYGFWR